MQVINLVDALDSSPFRTPPAESRVLAKDSDSNSETETDDDLPFLTQPDKLPLVKAQSPTPRTPAPRPTAKKNLYLSSDSDSETEIDLDEDEFDLPTAAQICGVTPVRSGSIKFGPPESESQPDRKHSPPPQRGKQFPPNPTPPQPEFLEEIEGGSELLTRGFKRLLEGVIAAENLEEDTIRVAFSELQIHVQGWGYYV